MGKRNAAAAIVDVDRLQQFETPPKRMKHAAAPAPAPAPAADDGAGEFTLSKEFVDGTRLMDLTLKQWRIGKPIGKGSFGEIFLASDDIDTPVTSENAMYVVKIEPHSNGPLFVEIHCLLNTAKRSDTCHIPPGMPEYIASGSHMFKNERYRFLILKRYERDLHSLIKNKRVNPPSIPVVACQILDVLEHLHDQGYVHSDIKAENLMIGKVPQGGGAGSASVNGRPLANGRNGSSGEAAPSAEAGKGGRRGRKGGGTAVAEPEFGGHLVENGLYQHQEQEMGGRVRNLRPLKTVTYRDLSDEDDRSRGGSSAGGGGVVGSKSDRAAHRKRGRKKNDDASFSCSISPRRSGYEELRAATEEAHWNGLRQHKHHLRAAEAVEPKATVPLEDRIHLIDFGLASKFMDSSGQHRPFCMDQRRAHDGTLEFTSRDAHMGAHARRSDLECLGYNLVYWSRGFLPWKDEKLLNQPEQVHRMKEYFMTDVREMLRLVYGDDCPAYLGDFLAYVGQLTYDDRPDYQYCRALFHKELKRLGCPVGRNQPLRLDVDAIERLSEPLTAQDEAEITNKINHVKSLMRLGGALFPYRESTLHSKASSPKNLRSKRRDTANGGRNSVATAAGAQAAGGPAAQAGGTTAAAAAATNVIGTRKREKKISCEEIFATDADQIARERVEKEYERAEQMEETVIRYTGRPTYAIQELERKMRIGGWCSGGGAGFGGLEYTESEDYIKGYTKPMMDILRKRQSQLFRDIQAANATASRNKEDDREQQKVDVEPQTTADQPDEPASDDGEAEVEQEDEEEEHDEEEVGAEVEEEEVERVQAQSHIEEDEEDDEEMEKRLRREKYYHDTDYEVQADEEEEDDELSTVEEEDEDEEEEGEEEEEEEEEEEAEEDEEEADDRYEEEEYTAVALHNGHATRKRQKSSAQSRPKKKATKGGHHHHKKQEEDTDSDFFNDGGCDEEEQEEEEEEEEEEELDAQDRANEVAEAEDGGAEGAKQDNGDEVVDEEEDEDEEDDQQDSDFNDQESTTSESDVVMPAKRRRIVPSTDAGHRRGSAKKSSANSRTLKAKVKGRGRKKSNPSSNAAGMEIHGNVEAETVVNGFSAVRDRIKPSSNDAGERRHSRKKHHRKQQQQHPIAARHVVDDEEDDGDNARHNGTTAAAAVAPVTVVRQSHHHNNNNHCNSKAYYGDVDDSSHDMAPPANGSGGLGLLASPGGGADVSKYRLVKRRKSCLRERIRPTDRGNDYDLQRKQKAAQRNKRRSKTAAAHRLELESTLHDDEEASCGSSSNIVSSSCTSSSSASSSTGSGSSASSSGSSTSHHSIATSSRGRTGSVPSSVVSEEAAFAIASFREETEDLPADPVVQKRKRGRPRKVPLTEVAATAAAAPPVVAHALDAHDSSNSSSIGRRRHRGERSSTTVSNSGLQDGGESLAGDASQTRWSRANSSSRSNRSAATSSRSSSVSTSTSVSGGGGGGGGGDGASTHEYGGSGGRLHTLPEDDDFLDEDDDDTRDVDYSPVCTRRKRKALTATTTSTVGTTGTGGSSSRAGTGHGISRRTTTAPVRKRNDSSKGGNGRGTGPATSSSSSSSSTSTAAGVADAALAISHVRGGASGGLAVVVPARRPEPEPAQAPVVLEMPPNRGRRFPQHQNYYHAMEEPLAPLHPHHHHHHQHHLQHHHPPTMLVRTYSRG